MSPLKPHLEVLPEAQKETWPTLGWAATNRFVLYGGTAIALRCGHRASIGFDFFTEQPLDQSTILQALRESGMAFRVAQDEKNSLTVVTEPGNDRLSFFGGLGMGRVGVPEMTEDGIVLVASSLDLLGIDDGDLTRVTAETRNILRNEAAKVSRVFPIPSIEKTSSQLSDVGIVRRANRDRSGLEF
jgi:hypothetical protein